MRRIESTQHRTQSAARATDVGERHDPVQHRADQVECPVDRLRRHIEPPADAFSRTRSLTCWACSGVRSWVRFARCSSRLAWLKSRIAVLSVMHTNSPRPSSPQAARSSIGYAVADREAYRRQAAMAVKIGFASLIGMEPMPFPDLVARAAAHRFDAIEVNVGANFVRIGDASVPRSPRSRRHCAQRSGRPARAAGQPQDRDRLARADGQPADRRSRPARSRIAEFRTVIDVAALLGVSTVVTFTGSAFGMHFLGHARRRRWSPVAIVSPTTCASSRRSMGRWPTMPKSTACGSPSRRPGAADRKATSRTAPSSGTPCSTAVPSPALGLSFDPSHLVWLQIPHIPGCHPGVRLEDLPLRRQGHGDPAGPPRPAGHPRQRLVALPAARARRARLVGHLLGPARHRLRRHHRDRERGSALPGRRRGFAGRPTICATHLLAAANA